MILKKVYVFENLENQNKSPYFQKRNEALKWEKENKNNLNEPIFLMKKEVTKKRYNQLISN